VGATAAGAAARATQRPRGTVGRRRRRDRRAAGSRAQQHFQ